MKKGRSLMVLLAIVVGICALYGAATLFSRVYLGMRVGFKHVLFTSDAEACRQAATKPLQHVGVIMDGNRRWARKAGLKPSLGHKKGVEPLRAVVELCLERSIPFLTVYAFSIENLKRSAEELDYLFSVIARELVDSDLTRLFDQGVRVRFYGDRSLFPVQIKDLIEQVEQKTKNNAKLNLGVLVCYGGQQEIVAAARGIAGAVAAGKLKPEAVDHTMFESFLWTAGVPNPDLIVRTGCAQRLSNFLLFKSAYSEISFVDVFWPDVTKKYLAHIFDEYQKVQRTFGV